MYQWSNKKRLDTLTVEGADNVLTFAGPDEKVTVKLADQDISEVVVEPVGGEAVTIAAAAAKKIVVGEGNTKRDVYHFLMPGGPAKTMRLGITKHCAESAWSSLPHDFELNTEPGFEEAFFHLLKGGSERAIQVGRGVWFDNEAVDSIWPVRNETFSTVPMGYHPVVGEPGVLVSYIWAYLAKKKEWEKI